MKIEEKEKSLISVLRKTSNNKWVGSTRIMLGVIFLMTGTMKLSLEEFAMAWALQLNEANIPLVVFNLWFVPVLEIILGAILLIGYYARISIILIIPIMLVAIYVHLTVVNPAAFPAQPQEPIIPIIIILIALIVFAKGAGSWSLDMLFSNKHSLFEL
jgi:uncharacterized membrane protein YphA (DoxX/SURF4 family)